MGWEIIHNHVRAVAAAGAPERRSRAVAALPTDQRHFRLAEALGRRALGVLEDVLGPGAAEVGLTMLNLATAISGQGRRAEAVTVAARAEAILADRLPAGHPHVRAARDVMDRLWDTS